MKSFPGLTNLLRQTRLASLYRLRYRFRSTRQVFTNAYHKNIWNGYESPSGTGASLDQTEQLRAELPNILKDLNVKIVLDAPCGDFNWLKETELPIQKYIGVDIVEEIIRTNIEKYRTEDREFLVCDVIKDDLPTADLILCRDLLVHLPFKHAMKALRNFKRSGSVYLLTTTFVERDENTELEIMGMWRPLNLQRPPFNLPLPIRLLNERCPEMHGIYADKSLGLWELSSL